MKRYGEYKYDVTQTRLTYVINFFKDEEQVGQVEVNKAGIIGDISLDNLAKECIDEIK